MAARAQSAAVRDDVARLELVVFQHERVSRGDVADHALFHQKFGCERVMHADDGARSLGVETVIEGEEEVSLDSDIVVIPTPGHTRGHIVFLYQQKFLFTGDDVFKKVAVLTRLSAMTPSPTQREVPSAP